MASGSDLAWLRKEAHLPLEAAAGCLRVSGLELWTWERQAKNVPADIFERVRVVYYQHQREAPAESREEEYIPGATEQGECSHHYRLESPSGPTSNARCLKCDFRRTFETAEPYHSVRPPPGRGVDRPPEG